MRGHSMMVLWIGAFVALFRSVYHFILLVVANSKLGSLSEIGATSAVLQQSIKGNLTEALINLLLMFCFGYALFDLRKWHLARNGAEHSANDG
jgi:hypothetical protein